MKVPMRIYVDTSVYGGAFDAEFQSASCMLFEEVRKGTFDVVVSPLVLDEIARAPDKVQSFFADMEPSLLRVEIDEAAYMLQQAYLDSSVVAEKWAADALHVAVATVTECRVIVSWNFKHIVNFRRIPLYNGVNQIQGYGPIAIHTPQEIVFNE
jgi:predicted nucleic acid-binding protein